MVTIESLDPKVFVLDLRGVGKGGAMGLYNPLFCGQILYISYIKC